MTKISSKYFEKKNIIILSSVLIITWLIGISNYYFSSASFSIEMEGEQNMLRKWIGNSDVFFMVFIINIFIAILWFLSIKFDYLDKLIATFINSIVIMKKINAK